MKLLQRLSAWLLRTVQRAPAWAVFGLGALIALPFHLMGINALDQSYVFDAAGRISLGQSFPEQVSFPYGHVPIFIQAVIFKLFGISWSAYGLHAALANGLWMLICHRLTFGRKGSMVSEGSHWAVPLAAGAMLASAGLSLYCLAATPFPEHHAQLFLAAGLVVMLVENRLAPQRRALLAGALFALALLSKQNPVVFMLPFVGAAMLILYGQNIRLYLWALLGGAMPFLLFQLYLTAESGLDGGLGYWQNLLGQAGGTGLARLQGPYFWPKIVTAAETPLWAMRVYPMLLVLGLVGAWQVKQPRSWALYVVGLGGYVAFLVSYASARNYIQYFFRYSIRGCFF